MIKLYVEIGFLNVKFDRCIERSHFLLFVLENQGMVRKIQKMTLCSLTKPFYTKNKRKNNLTNYIL